VAQREATPAVEEGERTGELYHDVQSQRGGAASKPGAASV